MEWMTILGVPYERCAYIGNAFVSGGWDVNSALTKGDEFLPFSGGDKDDIDVTKMINWLRGIHLNQFIVPIGMSQSTKSAGFIADTGCDYCV